MEKSCKPSVYGTFLYELARQEAEEAAVVLDEYIRLIYYYTYQTDIWRKVMNRQNIRKLILIISMLLFPITIWYMSPYLIIQGAMEGIVSGSFIVFVCMLLGSIFFGRIFCGWLCPMGIQVSEMISEGQVKSMECIQCGACIDGCPQKVLSYGTIEGRKGNGDRKKD